MVSMAHALVWARVLAFAFVLAQVQKPTTQISGRVVDASSGEPIAGASVQLTSLTVQRGTSAIEPVITNDRGEFSFTVTAGRYDLSARKPRYLSLSYNQRPGGGVPGVSIPVGEGQHASGIEFKLPRASVIAGSVMDTRGEPAQGAAVGVYRLEWRSGERGARLVTSDLVDDRGQFRIPGLYPGEYLVSAGFSAIAPASPTTTYYPGTPVATLALAVSLGLSEEKDGVSFQISSTTLASISGTVRTADGKPLTNFKVAAIDMGSALRGFSFRTTYSNAAGEFRIDRLAPGRYQVVASDDRAASVADARWALTDVNVDNIPVKDIALIAREGETVSGKLAFDGPNPPSANFRLLLTPLDRDPEFSASFQARVEPDGRFTAAGVMPGRYFLTIAGQPAGSLISAVKLDGKDVCDLPIDVRQSIQGLEVKLSSKGATLSGTLFEKTGSPSSDLLVIVFPAEETRWIPGSQRIRTARPGSDGVYKVDALPPGSYRVGVVTEAEPGEWFSRTFLQKVLPASVAVSLADLESKTLDVRVK